MAETGPTFSMFPTSNSRALAKIWRRRERRACAVQRYSSSPIRSSAANIKRAASRAETMAARISAPVMVGEDRLPKKLPMLWANHAVPTSTTNLAAVIDRIHPQRPLAMWSKVLFRRSIVPIPSFSRTGYGKTAVRISRGVGELSRTQTFGCTVTSLGQWAKGPCHIEEEKVCCGFALAGEGGCEHEGYLRRGIF